MKPDVLFAVEGIRVESSRGRGRERGHRQGEAAHAGVIRTGREDELDWVDVDEEPHVHPFTGKPTGPTENLSPNTSPVEAFSMLFAFAWPFLVLQMNLYAQFQGAPGLSPVSEEEMKAFIGVMMVMGIARRPTINS